MTRSWLEKLFVLLSLTVASQAIKQFKPFNFETSPLFVEQFHQPARHHWISSEAKKITIEDREEGKKVKEIDYSKNWSIVQPAVYPGFANDYGLVIGEKDQYYAISTAFDRPIAFVKDKSLILQYEVKFQEGLQCGGAYIRLFSAPSESASKTFRPDRVNDKTPFSIQFGPDKCGSVDRVHLIFSHLNKNTGKISEKHLIDPPMVRSTKLSTLYTLIIRPDGSFDVLVNREKARSGSLYSDFDPPLNTSTEMDDPEDFKPSDWIDQAKIPDPTAVKPANWDESAPVYISDQNARKPEGWLDDEPEMIPDVAAVKPTTWKDLEDGHWKPPLVVNSKCKVGCGKWIPPMMKNPLYKGRWTAPLIDNPAYRGPWKARQIPNPDHYIEENPASLISAIGVGFEMFTMQGGILFDNILITNDEIQANDFAISTWEPKYDLERIALERELKAKGISDERMEDFDSQAEEYEAELEDEFTSNFDEYYERYSTIKDALFMANSQWRAFMKLLLSDPTTCLLKFPVLTINTILITLCLLYLTGLMVEALTKWSTKRQRDNRHLNNKKDTAESEIISGVQKVQKSQKIDKSEFENQDQGIQKGVTINPSQFYQDQMSSSIGTFEPSKEDASTHNESSPSRFAGSQIPHPVSPIRPMKFTNQSQEIIKEK